MSITLQPCKSCGHIPRLVNIYVSIVDWLGPDYYRYKCLNCGRKGRWASKEENAAKNWNNAQKDKG